MAEGNVNQDEGGEVLVTGSAGGTWKWSNGKASFFLSDESSPAVLEISGLSLAGNSTSVLAELTVGNNGYVELTKNVLGASSITITDLNDDDDKEYKLKLATEVLTSASLDTGSYSVATNGTSGAVITAYSHDYYELDADWETTVTYHAGTAEKSTLATISGLSSNTADNVSLSGTTISLANGALGTNTIELKQNTTDSFFGKSLNDWAVNFSLSLAGDVGGGASDATAGDKAVGFVKGGNSWVISGTSNATYQYITAQGWSLNSAANTVTYKAATPTTLASVAGLSLSAIADGGLSGVTLSTIGGKSTFTLSTSILPTDSTKAATVSVSDNGSYVFALAGDSADGITDGKTGFTKGDDKWNATGGSATFWYNTTQGWELSSSLGGSITYTPTKDTNLAIINGLSSGITASGASSIDGIILNASNSSFTLSESVFDKSGLSSTVSLDFGNYSLALSSGINTKAEVATSANYAISAIAGGSAKIIGNVASYAIVAQGNKSIDYYKAQTGVDLITITGLSAGATSGVGISGTTITLTDAVLGTSGISYGKVSGISGIADYTFSLDGISKATASGIYDSGLSATITSVANNTAIIKGTTKEYYTLGTQSKSVVYNASESIALASITGLGASASTENVSLSGKTITLTKDALKGITENVKLTQQAVTDFSKDFKLTMAGMSNNKLGFETSKDYWTFDSSTGTATYQNYTNEGWTLNPKGTEIAHKAETDPSTLLTISNLSTSAGISATLSAGAKKDERSIDGIGVSGTTITLSDDFLLKFKPANEETRMTLGLVNGKGYKLKLGGDSGTGMDGTAANDGKVGFKENSTTDYFASEGTDVFYKHDIGEGWTLTEDKYVAYSASTALDRAKITGLKSGLSAAQVAGISIAIGTDSSAVIALTKDLLNETNGNVVTVTDEKDDDNITSYKLSIAGDNSISNITGKTATTDLFNSDDTTKTDILVKETLAAGWSYGSNSASLTYADEVDNTFATISGGLSSTALSNLSLSGTVISVEKDALTDGDVTLTNAANKTYTLALSGASVGDDDKNDKTFGFGNAKQDLDTNGGTSATYYFHSDKGWSINAGGTSIIFTDAAGTRRNLATIIGLNGGYSAGDISISGASTPGASGVITFTLKANALAGASSVSVIDNNDEDGLTFKLALDTGISNITGQSAVVGLSSVAGTVLVKETLAAGWTYGSGSTSLTYADKVDNTFATISGGGLSSTALANLSLSGTVISVSQSALIDGGVTLTNKEGKTYTLALSGASAGDEDKNASTFDFGNARNAWKSSTDTSATYYSYTDKGWTLGGDSKSITFTKEDNTYKPLATVDGLSATAGHSFTVGGTSTAKVIQLTDAALGTTSISLTDDKPDDNINFSLSFAGTKYKKDGDNGVVNYGFSIAAPTWSVNGGTTAVYQYQTDEGWVLDGGASNISYTPEDHTDLVTITGLKNKVTTSELANVVTTTTGYSGTITLTEGLLGDTDIALGLSHGGNYKLSFGNGTYSSATNIGSEKELGFADKYNQAKFAWSISGTEATLTRKIGKGWTLNGDSSGATYSGESTVNLLKITGLDSDADGKLENDAVSAISYSSATITLPSYVFDDATKTLKDEHTIELTYDKGYNYSLELAGASKITIGSASHVTNFNFGSISTGVATINETLKGGWLKASASTANGGSAISYTFYEDKNILHTTIEGLSSAASASNLSFSGTVISVSQSALKAGDVTLDNESGYSYTLALDGASSTDDDKNDKTFGFKALDNQWENSSDSTSAIYYSHTEAGWSLNADSKGITYTGTDELGKTKFNLATVKGLSATAGHSFTVGGTSTSKVIYLTANDLKGTSTISVVDNKDDGVDYALGFSSALATKTVDGVTKYGFSVAAPVWVIGSDSTSATYQYTTAEGWTLGKDGKITYTEAETTVLAKISGLSAGITENELSAATKDETWKSAGNSYGATFTLTQAMLANDSVSLDVKSGDYKLSFGGISTLGFGESSATNYWTADGNNATYVHKIGEGWTLADDGKSISYTKETTKDLLTINNLKSATTLVDGGLSGITVGGSYDEITLDKDLLGKDQITYTGDGFKFKLEGDDGNSSTSDGSGAANDGKIGFVKGGNEWTTAPTVSGGKGTAIYQYRTGEGWTLDEEGKTITYTAETPVTLASIAGLSPNISASSSQIAGISFVGNNDTDTITLYSSVLDNHSVTLTSAEGKSYKITLDGGVAKEARDASVWKFETNNNGGVAIYDSIKTGYYGIEGRIAVYTGESVLGNLASITGLATSLEANADRSTIVVLGGTSNAVTTLSGGSSIEISKYALNGKDIENHKGDYKLVKGEDIANPNTENLTWTVSRGNATLKGDIKEGYSNTAEGKSITYTKAVSNGNILVLSGLNSSVTANADGSIDGVIVDDNSGTVMLSKAIIGTTVSVKSGSYGLKLSDADLYTDGNKPTETDFWVVSNGTATYKNAVPAYYEKDSNGAIKFVQASTGTPYVEIKNLATNLTVSDAGKLGYIKEEDGSFVEAVTIIKATESATGTVTISDGALGTTSSKDASISSGNYQFVFSTAINAVTKPTSNDYAWTVETKSGKKTIKYTAETTAGYTLVKDGEKATAVHYSPAETKTLFTISGINANVEETNGGKLLLKDTSGNYIKNDSGKIVEAITVTAPTNIGDDGSVSTGSEGTIKLSDELLAEAGTATIKIEGSTAYKFANDNKISATNATAPTATEKWAVDGTSAKLISVTPAYAKFDDDTATTVACVGEAEATLATVKGLPEGAKLSNDGSKVVDKDGTTELITISGKVVTVKVAALSGNDISVTGDGYTLTLENADRHKPQDGSKVWQATSDGKSATLYQGKSAGYELTTTGTNANKEIKYKEPTATTQLAKITGLTGIKVENGNLVLSKDTTKTVATINSNSIKLDPDALGKNNIVLTNESGQSYTLSNEGINAPKTDGSGKGLIVSGTTVYLKEGNSAGYATATTDGLKSTLTYTAAGLNKTLETITGLKKGLTANAVGEVAGIDYTTTNTITLSADVLDPKSKVAIKHSNDSPYTLAVKDDAKPKDATGNWLISGTTVTYGTGQTAGYEIPATGTDAGKIVYREPTVTTKTIEITGLKSGLKLNDEGKIDGITITDPSGSGQSLVKGKVTLSKSVLGTSTTAKVKLETGSDNYEFVLGDDVTKAGDVVNEWTISGTTATLKKITQKGYAINADGTISYNSSKKTETLLSITGLKKGLTIDSTKDYKTALTGVEITEKTGTETQDTVKLTKDALGTSSAKISISTGYKNYKFATTLDASIPTTASTPTNATYDWSLSGTTATCQKVKTTEVYTRKSDKEITYTKPTYDTTFGTSGKVTVKGVKSIEGITVTSEKNEDTNGVITIDNRALENNKNTISVATTGYKLELDTTDPTNKVTKRTTTATTDVTNVPATVTTTTTAGYEIPTEGTDAGKIVYKAATSVKTTITGLKSGVKANDIVVDEEHKTITLKADALSTSKVTINGGDYTLKLYNSNSDNDKTDNPNNGKTITEAWAIDGTKATYNQVLPAGSYYCDGKTVTYMATTQTSKALATIEGLKSGLTLSSDKKTFGIGDATANPSTYTAAVSFNDGKIVLNSLALAEDTKDVNNKVKLTSNAYTLALVETGDNAVRTEAKDAELAWIVTDTTKGIATYGGGKLSYYVPSTDGKSLNYKKATSSNVKVKITGLIGATADDFANSNKVAVEFNNAETKDTVKTVKVSKSLLGAANVTVDKGALEFLEGESDSEITKNDNTYTYTAGTATNKFYSSGTTLTYETVQPATYKLDTSTDAKKKTITYTAPKRPTASNVDIKITNLKASAITAAKNGVGTIDGITIASSADSADGRYAVTINAENLLDSKNIEITSKDKVTVTVGETTKSVNKYKLVLGDEIEKTNNSTPEVTVSKGTATIKKDTAKGYSEAGDGNRIVYTKEVSGNTFATVKGLRNSTEVTADDIQVDDETGTITIGANALASSKVTLTNQTLVGGNYKLALADDVVDSDDEFDENTTDTWSTSGSTTVTATLKKNTPIRYSLAYASSDTNKEKAIGVNYTAAKSTVIGTVTGLKKGVKAVDGEIDGIDVVAPVYRTKTETIGTKTYDVTEVQTNGIITINPELNLGTTTVKVTKGDYILQCDDYQKNEISDETWTVSKGNATLKGAITGGFYLSDDEKTLTYTKANSKLMLASIKGLSKDSEFTFDGHSTDGDRGTINLAASDLDTVNKVTVTSSRYEFDFDDDTEAVSITGSSGSDSISVGGENASVNTGNGNDYVTVSGNGSTVNAGKGNDYVTFYGNSNVFVYAKDDGNDVIADFDYLHDQINITTGSVSVKSAICYEKFDYDGDGEVNDVRIDVTLDNKRVVKGSITLKDILDGVDENGTNAISITNTAKKDSNGAFIDLSIAIKDLQNLTKTESAATGYVLGDSDFSLTPTPLGNQSDTVAYSGDDSNKK